jgi:UDP-glucose 4-epimerase
LKNPAARATRLKLVAAANKAFIELGWKPQFPKLEDIVKTAWAWHVKHPDGYAD